MSFAIAVALSATAASAQLLGGGGGLLGGGPTGGGVIGGIGQTVGGIGNSVDRQLDSITGNSGTGQQAVAPTLDRVSPLLDVVESAPSRLVDLRRMRLEALIRANRDTLDRDNDGQPVRKGELLVADPDAQSLALAAGAGFRILRDDRAGELGLRIVTLSVPRGMNVRDGRKRLAKIAPTLDADYNHVFEPAGGALATAAGASLAASTPFRVGTKIAMIDGGVASHSSMARAAIEQRGFAGPAQPTGHGTAVGSLLVGNEGVFRGAATGAQLFVGDVYGGNPAAGSASVIVKALAWAASKQPEVINISLVGPANRILARAIAALQARRIGIVAAVGNDGPAAPPQYPASYPGVIAVTGVDASNRALREAGRSPHLDFAAPGADLVAAMPGKGFTEVRGTSFAAPLVSARLAAARGPASLAREAVPGKGKVGRGIVCGTCRVAPKAVGLK
ncbi:S8 family serine peptidase [Sphingomonas xanthus]|uniref:S8 family serine peptidase n=1 Tax=Sphingomonas xanthus TaxID=2594473 RepID=A0A516IUE3_9SPHN|nr:S8 family serine peptidase [Sphingomonas xanthus]QDP20528.1 S8 family serine peptidase [Sphingomonas xanthus]